MQTNLFDDENYYRNAYHLALNEYDLLNAVSILKKWQKTFFPPADLNDKIKALEKLSLSSDDEIHELSELYVNLYSLDYLSVFKDERRYIKRGLTQEIYSFLIPENYDFIIPKLHPAEIYINMEDYKSTLRCCGEYLNHKGEHSLIRQFNAYAYYQKGETNSASISTTYALFNNVLQCSTEFLCPGNYVKKYNYLEQTLGNHHSALLKLPFALWKDGKTFIVPNDDKFEKYLRKRINREKKVSAKGAEETTIYFYHLQYLAEMIRLRNTRKSISQELMDIRTEMKEVKNDMFIAYMDVLSSAF